MTAAIASNRFFHHPTAWGPVGETPPRLRVLVAEDDEPNQQVFRVMLERRGYSVRIAANGRQALAALDEETFDLLLLDVRMPEMDGWQVVKSLRRSEAENPGCGRSGLGRGLDSKSSPADRPYAGAGDSRAGTDAPTAHLLPTRSRSSAPHY